MSAEWKGVKEALAAVRGLGDMASTEIQAAAIRPLANELADGIRRNVHNVSGLTDEDVRTAQVVDGDRVEIHVGGSERAFILGFLERGVPARGIPAQAPIRRAWDAQRADFLPRAMVSLRKSYERVRSKYARRAA